MSSWCSLESVTSWVQLLLYKHIGHCMLERLLRQKGLGVCEYASMSVSVNKLN